MGKGSKIGLVILGIVVLLCLSGIAKYNGIVKLKESVDTQLSNVDVALQRRADLIPNLVNTVKGYVKHEEAAINSVTEARAKLVGATTIDEKSKANAELTKSLSNLMVIVENYPDLKANTTFVNLQDELAGTENRVSTARRDYNDAVSAYNKSVQLFPGSIIAKMFGFEKMTYFEAEEGKTDVPNVEF